MKNRLSILVIVLASLFSNNKTLAVTAYPLPVDITQKDGSRLTIILRGDEYIKWAVTTDGYSLLRNKGGIYEYAVLNSDNDLVPSGTAARNREDRSITDEAFLKGVNKGLSYSGKQKGVMKSIINLSLTAPQKAFPTTGSRKLVCILIGFKDVAFQKAKSDYENLFNQVGYSTDGASGSVYDFYKENSYGNLDLTVTVAGPFTAANNMAYYGGNDVNGYDMRPRDLVTEAVNLANSSVNFADFDNDGNGYVDGVYVIYAGYGEEYAGVSSDAIWAHAWGITPVTLDGKIISSYSCSSELRGNSGSNITRIGVICHEFGHVMGAHDYYDTDYETGGQYSGTGIWDLMAGGTWNNSGATPAHHNPYTIINSYGWASATTLSSSLGITMTNAEQNSGSFYRINTTTANEYFLLENRQQHKFDTQIPGHGLIIYHVDDNYISSNAYEINAGEHQGMYQVCASAAGNPPSDYGTINASGLPFPGSSGKTSFSDLTTPSSQSWALANTNIIISNIAENITNKTISFDFTPVATVSRPALSTTIVSSITISAASSGGNVTSDGGGPITLKGVCWSISSGPTMTDNKTVDGSGTGIFSSSITGLTSGTTYYVRAYATNSAGGAYGNEISFTTNAVSLPVITTSPITSVLYSSSISGGEIIFDGGSEITARGVCWSESSDPTLSNSLTNDGTGTGQFESSITGLLPGKTYHVRAYATNIGGTSYGEDLSFNTKSVEVPILNTTDISSILKTSAFSGGNITSNGGAEITQRGVCWNNTGNPTKFSAYTSDGTGTESFTSRITGLTGTTTYYVRAYAINSAGTSYGNQVSFTTSADELIPTVSAPHMPEGYTKTSVTLYGDVSSDGGADVLERGVCWSTSVDPTIDGDHVFNGSGLGAFTCSIAGLTQNTTYYARAYATNNAGTAYSWNSVFKTTLGIVFNPDLKYGSVKDIDEHTYKTIQIGNQTWMAENLKTTKYNDETPIPNITDDVLWSASLEGAYCDYINAPATSEEYGRLYNWYAVDNNTVTKNASNKGKNVCPIGWHVSSEDDWTTLVDYLGETTASAALKEEGSSHWFANNGTNSSGFTAISCGYRRDAYLAMGWWNFLWESPVSNFDPEATAARCIISNYGYVTKPGGAKNWGFSVRCVQDVNPPLPQYFAPAWWPGNGIDHMNLYALSATLDGTDLQPGDEIGVFDGNLCVGAGIMTEALDGSNYLAVSVSKDDPDSEAKEGYTSGNSIAFRVWDYSSGSEISYVNANYISGVGIFSQGASATFNLSAISYLIQNVSLASGWNIISFAIIPPDMSLKTILNPLITAGTLVKVQDKKGNAIEQIPVIGWVDNIGVMKVAEGYKIKVSTAVSQDFTGLPVTLPYTISLDAGWNIMGYPSLSAQAALTAFDPLITAGTLIKVQDERGNAIEKIPVIGWIDNVKNLNGGKGYKVKTSVGTTLIITAPGKGEYFAEETLKSSPSHFKTAWSGNGLDHMNIYITKPTLGGEGLKAGDEIGVFDGIVCVGAVVIEDPENGFFMAAASLDDPVTDVRDGFTPGNELVLRLWDSRTGTESMVKETDYQKGYGKFFEKNGTTVLKADFEREGKTVLRDAFPNPSKERTTFTFETEKESDVRLELFNVKGDLVKILVNDRLRGGVHNIEWDNRSGSREKAGAGIYFYRLKTDRFIQTKQLVVY